MTSIDPSAVGSPDRQPLQEFPRPDVIEHGRLRLIDYPLLDPDIARVDVMRLESKAYPNAVALPLSTIDGKNRKLGAVYSRNGRLVPDSERAVGRPGDPWHSNKRVLPARPATADVVAGRSFYLGHWSPGFGHTLLELLPRLWPRHDYRRYDRFVLYRRFFRGSSTPLTAPTRWFTDLLGAFGIGLDKLVVVDGEPVGFERLHVTTPAFIVKGAADPRFLDVFRKIKKRVLASHTRPAARDLPRRVYLSRSQMPTRVAANEADLEVVMQAHGFTVLHPQNLTIAEQVAVMARATVVAGCDGSALHMAAFARPGTKLLAVDSRIVASQLVIDRVRGLDAVHLLAVDEPVHNRSRWVADLSRVEAALDLLLRS